MTIKNLLLPLLILAFCELPTAQAAAPEACPRSFAEWSALRSRLIDNLSAKDGLRNSAAFFGWVAACTESDAQFKNSPGLNACWKRVYDFTRDLNLRQGLDLSIEEYRQYSAAQVPGLMDIPDSLVSAEVVNLLKDPNSQKNMAEAAAKIEAIAKKTNPGSKSFAYRSRHLSSPDPSNSMGRLLLYLPGERFDQWIQYAVPGPEKWFPSHPETVSLVAIQKTDAASKPLEKPRAFFTDYFRTYQPGKPLVQRPAANEENCANCHVGGIIPLAPLAFDPDQPVIDGPGLKLLNSKIDAYGPVELARFPMSKLGAWMGPVENKGRTIEFMRSCTKKYQITEAGMSKVQEAMSCANCHDGVTRNPLRYPVGYAFRKADDRNLLSSFVHRSKMMPPGADLTFKERQALENCLIREYYGGMDRFGKTQGILKTWLSEPVCAENAESARGPSSKKQP